MPYQFTSVLDTFKQAHANLANSTDDAAKTAHDRKVYAAIGKPFAEVKKFYEEFERFLALAKTQSKSNIDAIVEKYNTSKGKPDDGQLKLMKSSLAIINNVRSTLEGYQKTLKTDLMDWRGVWDKTCATVVFSKTGLEAITAYRKSLIDKQGAEWNSTMARIEQYVTRAEALVVAAEKAAKTAPANDGSETLAQIKDAHTKAMSTGVKSVTTYMANIENSYDKLKTEAKAGIHPNDKPNAAKLWKSKEAQFTQFSGYQKDLSGAIKTLTMLTKLIANGMAKVAKEHQGGWKTERDALKRDLGNLESALKKYPDMLKNMETIKKQYNDAIHGR